MDIPTVIYWNTSHWEIRDEAIPYFEDLKSVGIFHETPESAAEHVKRVWDKVDEWWYGEHLREVLARFKKNFCHVPADLIADLHTTIRDCEGSN
jgi:putative transferase (TIGR04331 family)